MQILIISAFNFHFSTQLSVERIIKNYMLLKLMWWAEDVAVYEADWKCHVVKRQIMAVKIYELW